MAVLNAGGSPKGRFRVASQQVARRANGLKWFKYVMIVMYQYVSINAFRICLNQLMSFSGQLPLKDYSFPQMEGVMRSSFAIR